MNKLKSILMLAIILTAPFVHAADNDPWDGSKWNVAGPDIDQPIGNSYKEIFDLRKGIATRINKEHETLATSSAGGVHKQGSARAFFQDAAPTIQIDGTAWDSGDTGSFWFDTNATPDNLFYVLTNSASTGTWTLVSTSLIAETVAAAHSWADVQTFDVAAIFTTGLTSNDDITLGAGDDIVMSATSNILVNTDKFTVAGATGNTLVAGTLDVTGDLDPTSFTTANGGFIDEDSMATDSAVKAPSQQSLKAYVDAQIAGVGPAWTGWNPTCTQGVGVSITGVYTKYVQIGKVVIIACHVTVTDAGTSGQAIVIGNLPVNIDGNIRSVGSGTVTDSGTAAYPGDIQIVSATSVSFVGFNQGSVVGVTPGFALASGDIISFLIIYESA